jgi:hypothetical protein
MTQVSLAFVLTKALLRGYNKRGFLLAALQELVGSQKALSPLEGEAWRS